VHWSDVERRRDLEQIANRRPLLSALEPEDRRPVDLEKLAQRTERFTGADLEDLVRRAGLTALRAGLESGKVKMADFETVSRNSARGLSGRCWWTRSPVRWRS
jgi:SpoVK/Ycf46/Vps4 family AAA+-type ATPase